LLATVGPDDLSVSANNPGWLFGPYPPEAPVTIGMAFANGTASAPGDHCTASAELRVPQFTGRLRIGLFRADDYSNPEWPGYRFYQLLIDGEVVWEEDVTFEETERWVTVDVTDALRDKERAELAIRVLDKRGVGQYGTASLVGPVRLVGLPQG
jgi:hypothetical protein